MSARSSNSDGDDEERPGSRVSDLAGLAIGGGLLPDAGVGMSSPLPYPRHEKGASSVGQPPTVNKGKIDAQHKSLSAALSARSRIRHRPTTQNYHPLLPPVTVPGNHQVYMNNTGRGLVQLAPNVGRPCCHQEDRRRRHTIIVGLP